MLLAFSGTRYFSVFSLHSPAMKLKNSCIFIIPKVFSASKANSKHALILKTGTERPFQEIKTMHQELEKVLELLRLEWKEDQEQFKQMIEELPLHERIQKGYTWHPIIISKKGFTIGDRAYLIVERSKKEDTKHQFRAGISVRLFSEIPAARKFEKTGVVHYVDKNKMKIILNSRDLPEWLSLGQVGVDMLFDERTYVEMEKAMLKVMEVKNGRLAELRSILIGKQLPSYNEVDNPVQLASLNPSQNNAINDILSSRDVAVVHGPPGTGKTTTLVEAVDILSKREPSILVTAPSNTAVDLLTERLAKKGLTVVRIGNISRVDEDIVRHSLEVQVADHPESKNIKKIKQEAEENRRKANRYKRKFGRAEYLEKKRLLQEASELNAWANKLEDRLIDQIIDNAQVVLCTLVGANSKVLGGRKFRTVFIDEAAQALEPASWIPILKSSRVVLVGDPFQLPPTVKSMEAQRGGFNITLIEKAIARWDHVCLLNVQYRMNSQIMEFSNQQFYNGELKAASEVEHHKLNIQDDAPVVFIDTAGCGFDEKIQPNYRSKYNPDEFHILCEHLYQLVDSFPKGELPSIALISPYKEQVTYMKAAMAEDAKLMELPITINTIDGFQGQEKDVIYISLVRSNAKSEIGFLKDYRRMNVAMTRARKKLVIVGDSATIGASEFYGAFLHYCESIGSYRTAWEYMRAS